MSIIMTLLSQILQSFNNRDRFEAELSSLDSQVTSAEYVEAVPNWVESARACYKNAMEALNGNNFQQSWTAAQESRRYLIFGMNESELKNKAIQITEEGDTKLSSWRKDSVTRILSRDVVVADDVVQAQEIMDGRHQNQYEKMRLIRSQLLSLYVMVTAMMIGVLRWPRLFEQQRG